MRWELSKLPSQTLARYQDILYGRSPQAILDGNDKIYWIESRHIVVRKRTSAIHA